MRFEWAEHVAWMGKTINAYRILTGRCHVEESPGGETGRSNVLTLIAAIPSAVSFIANIMRFVTAVGKTVNSCM
jgi:hypothetical protein